MCSLPIPNLCLNARSICSIEMKILPHLSAPRLQYLQFSSPPYRCMSWLLSLCDNLVVRTSDSAVGKVRIKCRSWNTTSVFAAGNQTNHPLPLQKSNFLNVSVNVECWCKFLHFKFNWFNGFRFCPHNWQFYTTTCMHRAAIWLRHKELVQNHMQLSSFEDKILQE